jgi:TonB family protein
MKPQSYGSYVLVDLFSETSLGPIYKALPLEGPPAFSYLHALPADVAKNPNAATLLLTHAQRWKAIHDLHALNILDFGQDDAGLFYTFECQQGRLLSDVLKRCASEGIPLAPDQAVYLADRIAGALVSFSTAKLFAGYLSPEQVLVTFEGEVKLLPCILRDLQTTPLRESDLLRPYLRYLLPAARDGKPSKAPSDRYAVGLLLFEFLCREPFFTGDVTFNPAARLDEAERGLGMADGLAPSLMRILRRALLPETPEAYPDLDKLKDDLDGLITSGEYSPTTFNIAFLMHSLFRGEDEAENALEQQLIAIDREACRPKPPVPEPEPAPPPKTTRPMPPPPTEEPASFGVEPEPSRKGLFIGLGAAAMVVLGIVVGFLFFNSKGSSESALKAKYEAQLQAEKAKLAEAQKTIADQLAKAQADKTALEQQMASAKTTEEKAKAKKALDEAKAKIEEQQKQQAALAAQAAPAPAKPEPSPPPQKPPEPPPATTPPATAPPSSSTTAPAEPARGTEPGKVQRGDFVEGWALDAKPKPDREIKADYTPMARQNRAQGRVTLEVSVDENGRATSAQVLKGLSPDYGIHDALVRAATATKFSPGMKDGVPVKTKYVVNLNYAMK